MASDRAAVAVEISGEGGQREQRQRQDRAAHICAGWCLHTATDDRGAKASESRIVTVIRLTAVASKVKCVQKTDLSWTGPASAAFDVYRNAAKIATVQAAAYTDTVNKGAGSYTYKVCVAATSSCSNEASVVF